MIVIFFIYFTHIQNNFLGNDPNQLQKDPVEKTLESPYYYVPNILIVELI